MQVPSVPLPIVTNALPQEAVAKAVPNVQAMAPLLANAVAPAPKSEKSNQSRGNKDRKKEENPDGGGDKGNRGGSVNIRV